MKTFKKFVTVAVASAMALSVFACSNETAETEAEAAEETEASETEAAEETEASETEVAEETEAVAINEAMSYADYIAADLDTEVTVDVYVQATQSWWDNTITVYAADEDGAYFIYGMACSEEDAANLTAGTEILVTGYKTEWSGEVEIADATFVFVDGNANYVAEAVDLTADFDDEAALEAHQNEFFTMTDLTVEAADDGSAFLYSWDGSGSQGDDLYFKVTNGTTTYTFTVESYLTGADTEVYQAVEALNVGDTIDVEGFLYWYEGVNPHITSVTVK